MTWQSRWQCGLALACLTSSGLVAAELKPSTKPTGTNTPDSIVELRGKLVPMQPPVTHAAFRTETGEIYTLLSNRLSSALFLDTNLRPKTLLLRGRVVPATGVFEVTRNLRSFHDGKIHELAYYCDICAITSTEAGECMCCREPVRLVEDAEANPKLKKPTRK